MTKVVGILIIIDTILTYIGIQIGIVETNPVARSLGITVFLLLKLISGVAVSLLSLDRFPHIYHKFWLSTLILILISAVVKSILDFELGPVT